VSKPPRELIGTPGDALSFVTLESTIASPGEQGEVWKAHATGHENINFAVKIGRSPITRADLGAYARFKEEFSILSKMRHPNIVKVYAQGDFETDAKNRHPFYVMEYLGEPENVSALSESKILRDPRAARGLCLKALFETASALRHLHSHAEKGRHLDIKGSNILTYISDKGLPAIKLIDFGFAKFLARRRNELGVDKAGRITAKISSIHRPVRAKSGQHLDLWQLAFVIKRLLGESSIPPGAIEFVEDWPIDYAHLPRVMALLNRWTSLEVGNAAETAAVTDFYAEIDELAAATKTTGFGADLRGAIRYLAIPEVAMAAKVCSAAHSIRIPPRQLVLYSDRIAKIFSSPPFTALEYTRQLGFTHLVYPGALGTRFEHSVGVFNLATHFIVRMAAYPAFRQICADPKDILLFIIASLLHDVGHFPYAHQLEEFTQDDFNDRQWRVVKNVVAGHHSRTKQILSRDLLSLLVNGFDLSIQDIDLIFELIECGANSNKLNPGLRFLHQILDGPIDLDKLDYVERDAHHCGVPYGSYIDIERILETMRIVHDPKTAIPTLAFDQRAVGCLEQLVTARHQMYANVYWHRAVRAATSMFKHLFYLFQNGVRARDQIEKMFFKAGSDDRLLLLMEERLCKIRPRTQAVKAAIHLARVVSGQDRNLYKAVLQHDHDDKARRLFGGFSYSRQRKKAKRIFEILRRSKMWDRTANEFGEHNVLIDCREDSWPSFDKIQIRDGLDGLEPLTTWSPTVQELRHNFVKQACQIRVFINVTALKRQYRNRTGRIQVARVIRDAL
jgi:HD superfamily phosphohydrolase